uniref:Uncharacterized protein n=1 Tax=Parascaris univalens TaxID=6257 RepID=A0A914ZIV0_PARUN
MANDVIERYALEYHRSTVHRAHSSSISRSSKVSLRLERMETEAGGGRLDVRAITSLRRITTLFELRGDYLYPLVVAIFRSFQSDMRMKHQ